MPAGYLNGLIAGGVKGQLGNRKAYAGILSDNP